MRDAVRSSTGDLACRWLTDGTAALWRVTIEKSLAEIEAGQIASAAMNAS
jgi:hypothetical protein